MSLKMNSVVQDIKINMPNLIKIEKLLNDSSYSELIEISANFNTRLCVERKLRMPFLDPQTGVAQKHSNLHKDKKQRIPGLRDGQIYTYPSTRWKKNKRTTTSKLQFSRPFSSFRYRGNDNGILNSSSSSSGIGLPNAVHSIHTGIINPPTIVGLVGSNEQQSDFQAMIDESNEGNSLGADTSDSKDSQQHLKEEVMPKEWYYEELDQMNEIGSEEQGDSDYDYNINGYKRKRKAPVIRKSSRKPRGETSNYNESPRKGRPIGSATGSGASLSRKSRKNPRSSRNTKSETTETATVPPKVRLIEPPSFESVQGDLNLNENGNHGAYLKYL